MSLIEFVSYLQIPDIDRIVCLVNVELKQFVLEIKRRAVETRNQCNLCCVGKREFYIRVDRLVMGSNRDEWIKGAQRTGGSKVLMLERGILA